MVIYTCPDCKKDFFKKCHFENHVNRKYSCKQTQILIQNYPKTIQNNPIPIQNNPKPIQNNPEIPLNNPDIKYSCEYCNKNFYNGSNLNKHILNNCKVKKEDDNNKKNIFELLLEQERKEKELLIEEKEQERKEKQILNNKVDELQKQLLDLTKTIRELSTKSATIINNNNNYGNINNITIPLDKLSKFGKEDLTKITHKEFLKIKNYQGVAIFMETAKLIYNNHSVNKTVYVADYSRKKAMIWNGEKWVLTCLEEVLDVMKERIRTLYNINLDLIEDNKVIKDFETRVQKYFEMLYDEYDEEKKDDKKFIERVNKLQEKYGNDLILWLTNIKKDVMNNFNNISNKITNDKILLIENEIENEEEEENQDDNHVNPIIDTNILQPIKKRGRPKKINNKI
jgi:hypothetical protein